MHLAQENIDLQTANIAIAADIAVRSSPKTRSRCAESPCLGVSQAELGLSLIASRSSPPSLKALAELIRFRLDGGLAEEFSCAAARKGKVIRTPVISINAIEIKGRCVSDYATATSGYPTIFPAADSIVVCRSTKEIDSARRDILRLLASKKTCTD